MQGIEKNTDIKADEIFKIKIHSILRDTIDDMDSIVKHLASNKMTREFIVSKKDKERLEEIFFTLVGTESKIMQARILDESGNEVIRIERNSQYSEPLIVESSKLQNKSQRDYFKTLSAMESENVWHSKIDLNIENEKVEIPYKPTIRIGIPIIEENRFRGAIIINMTIKNLLKQIGNSSAFEHYIIDKDKNYILHPKEEYSFNKYKNIKRSLKDDFPNGLNENGTYVYPLDEILQNEDNALLILKTKGTYKRSLKDDMLKTTIAVLILTIGLSFVMSLYASKSPAKLQASLLDAHKKLKEFTSIIDRYIITATTKPDGTILDVSSAFERSSGYTKNELLGKKMNIIKSPDRDSSIIAELWSTICSNKIWIGEIENQRKDKTKYWLEQHIIPKVNQNNKIDSFVSIGIDITAKKELEKLATIDKLTNIYNRRRIDEFLQAELEIEKRHSQNLSVILIDIDHFKSVNDTYGHQTGDAVLKKTADIISKVLRKSDIFGRYGGEEFVVICPQTDKENAFVLAQKLGLAMKEHDFEKVGQKTISMGVAQTEESDDEKSLLEKADKALYEAKNSGRDRAVIYKS